MSDLRDLDDLLRGLVDGQAKLAERVTELELHETPLESNFAPAAVAGLTGSIADTASEAIFNTAAGQIHLVTALANDGTINYVLAVIFCESDGGTNWVTLAGSASGVTITNSGVSIQVTNNTGGAKVFKWSAFRLM